MHVCFCVSDILIVTDCLSLCAQIFSASQKHSWQLPYSNDSLILSPLTAHPLTGTEWLLFVSCVLYCRHTCGSVLVWSTSVLHPALWLIETDGGVEEGEEEPWGQRWWKEKRSTEHVEDIRRGGREVPLTSPEHVNKHYLLTEAS